MPIMECLIKRPGGTTVTFPGAVYHFAPADKGAPHLCDVTNQEHADRLAAIPEGYRYATGTPAAKLSVAEAAQHDAAQCDATPGDAAQESEPAGDEKARRKAAAAAYKDKFGQSAPSRWSAERIEQELEA